MSDLRFAIIGCGKIAPRHAEQIIRVGKLVAVCDIIPERAKELGSKYNAKPYFSEADLFSNEANLDLVSICTPNYLHPQQSISALQYGINVLCEKPLAISVKDAESMIAAAKETGRKLFVVKSSRYNPVLQLIKEVLDEGRLGRVYSFQLSCFWNRPVNYYLNSWRGSKIEDGGTLFTQFSHYIDVLYWLLGDMKTCYAMQKNYAHEGVIEFEDTGVVMLEMQNDIIGTINYSVNSFSKNMEVSLTLIGEKGTVKIGGEYMNRLEYQDIRDFNIEELPQGNKANEYGFYRGSMGNHKEVYDNLVKALSDNNHPFTDAEVGLKTVEIIERIYASSIKVRQ